VAFRNSGPVTWQYVTAVQIVMCQYSFNTSFFCRRFVRCYTLVTATACACWRSSRNSFWRTRGCRCGGPRGFPSPTNADSSGTKLVSIRCKHHCYQFLFTSQLQRHWLVENMGIWPVQSPQWTSCFLCWWFLCLERPSCRCHFSTFFAYFPKTFKLHLFPLSYPGLVL